MLNEKKKEEEAAAWRRRRRRKGRTWGTEMGKTSHQGGQPLAAEEQPTEKREVERERREMEKKEDEGVPGEKKTRRQTEPRPRPSR